jgi:hypothetical protein
MHDEFHCPRCLLDGRLSDLVYSPGFLGLGEDLCPNCGTRVQILWDGIAANDE